MKHSVTNSILLFSAPCIGAESNAQLLSITPFTGEHTETWEQFPTTLDANEQVYTPSPLLIMDGNAIIANPTMDVYQSSGTPYLFNLGTSGIAQTSDGLKGMVVGGFAKTVSIDFLSPQLAFGAYWGAWTHTVFGTDPAILNIEIYDAGNQLIDSDSFTYSRSMQQDGLLEWHGWASDAPFSRIVYTGDYPTIDGLQATTIPEPAAILPLAMAAMLLRRSRT